MWPWLASLASPGPLRRGHPAAMLGGMAPRPRIPEDQVVELAEMFRLMRNSGVDIAEQQLEEQRKTNELLSDGEDMTVYDMGA